MASNAFIGKLTKPTDTELTATLGPRKKLWDQLIEDLAGELGVKDQEWNSYSKKAGWALRLKRNKRNIIYMSPMKGAFRIALIFGSKAVEAALQSDLPKPVLKMIADAIRYPEGRAIRMSVTKEKDLAIIKSLVAIKLQN